MNFFYLIRNYINDILFNFYILFLKLLKPEFSIGKNFHSFGLPLIQMSREAQFRIGNNLQLNNHTKYNMVGLYKQCSFFIQKNAKLKIGDNCGFSGVSIYCSSEIQIGNNCNFGGNVCIWDTDFHPTDYLARRINDMSIVNTKPIFIGDDVFVGANSIILKGLSIGNRSLIGAASVVTKDIPNDEMWAGNPAKFIKKLKI